MWNAYLKEQCVGFGGICFKAASDVWMLTDVYHEYLQHINHSVCVHTLDVTDIFSLPISINNLLH